MKAILYNGRTPVGETADSRFAIYYAMISHPEITHGEIHDDKTGYTMVIRRDLTPRRYLNPANYTQTLHMYDNHLVMY